MGPDLLWLCQVVVCVSAGYRHSAAVSEDGELYTWGEGDFGRLGKLLLLATALHRSLCCGDPSCKSLNICLHLSDLETRKTVDYNW